MRGPQYSKPTFRYSIHLIKITRNRTEAKITAILERVLDVFCFIIARRKLPPSSLFCSAFRWNFFMGCSALIGQSDMPELFDQENSYKPLYLACNIIVVLVDQSIESQCVTPYFTREKCEYQRVREKDQCYIEWNENVTRTWISHKISQLCFCYYLEVETMKNHNMWLSGAHSSNHWLYQ